MPDDTNCDRMVALLEHQLAPDRYFRGANQNSIARVLQKSKTWVNDLLRDPPKGDKS